MKKLNKIFATTLVPFFIARQHLILGIKNFSWTTSNFKSNKNLDIKFNTFGSQLLPYLVKHKRAIISKSNYHSLKKMIEGKKNGIWYDYFHTLTEPIIDIGLLLDVALSDFFNKELSHVSNKNYILSQLKIRLKDGQFRSISYVQTYKKNEYNDLLKSFIYFLDLKLENYIEDEITDFVFSYKILDLNSPIKSSKINLPDLADATNEIDTKKKKTFKKFGYNLPRTMDFTLWGEIIKQTEHFAVVLNLKSRVMFLISIFSDYIEVEAMIGNRSLFNFKDVKNNKDANLNSFTRYIKDQVFVFEDSELILILDKKKTTFLKHLKQDRKVSDKIITMDLETRAIEGYFWPFCISTFDGKTEKSFYLSEYKNSDSMIEDAIKSIMLEKYNKHKVFLHNFSYFDSSFLISAISDLSDKVKPIIRDGRIIDFKCYYKKHYYLNFRDSLLLLPVSLSKLAKCFNLENKGIFPYKFVDDKYNSNINLEYKGKVPRLKFFDVNKISSSDFNKYIKSFKNKLWSLKNETIKYCSLDAKILYNVLIEFNKIIYKNYKVDALKYPTISSLAFAIYRTKYLKPLTIPLISGKIYKDLKASYTGGASDVYKPLGKNIKCYDVNSLFPSVMANNIDELFNNTNKNNIGNMPVGNPTFFEGDIFKFPNLIKDPFGFFEVEVKAPLDLNIPILQTRLKTEYGYRTVAPVGNWIGTYFSEELKEAKNLGYSFNILRGYLFDRSNIFKEFINDLYHYKEISTKDSAYYIIFKLLMNSLYGRFGLKPEKINNLIIPSDLALDYHNNDKFIVTNVIKLKNSKELISFFDLQDPYKDVDRKYNASVSIASAITSYARIYMSRFKILLGDQLYYSDTDSLFTSLKLDSKYLSNTALGKLKLERIFERAIFLSSKMYGGKYKFENKLMNYVKIKGLKIPIDFSKLYSLLFKNKKITLEHVKWFRDTEKSTIKSINIKHTLKLASFKRKIIYENNKFTNTKPIVLKDSKF